jgi:mitochondrial fission process protein 1
MIPTLVPSDVGYESYKAHRRGPTPFQAAHFTESTRVGLVAVKRAAFQSVASMCVLVILYT